MNYGAPGMLANMLAGLIPDMSKAKILDLAAGSGKIFNSLFVFLSQLSHTRANTQLSFSLSPLHLLIF